MELNYNRIIQHFGIFLVTNGVPEPAQLCLEFRVFLVSAQTGKHKQESRTLQFWFSESLPNSDQPSIAQEFFRELVSPQEFPRGIPLGAQLC